MSWKKERIDCTIEELKKKKKVTKIIAYSLLFIIAVVNINVIHMMIIGNAIAMITGFLILLCTTFLTLITIDSVNDINRINIWIFLKQKLGE